MRNIYFAKTKRARAVCAVLAAITLALAVFAAYYAVGNLRCAAESPYLVGESGDAIFLGYYLLAAAYIALCVLSGVFCFVFTANAVRIIGAESPFT